MNYFDTFDENGVFISSEDEQDVHYKGLWHKVIRIWLYDANGNIWLKRSRSTGKLDTINEVHLLSSESVTNCFDRALFEKLGIHLPATSRVEFVGMKKMSVEKKYSDNSEFKGNYFLCDYIADFNDNIKFFIFDDDTEAVVKCNSKGINNLLGARVSQVLGLEFGQDANNENKIAVSFNDIERNPNEDAFAKFSSVSNVIDINAKKLAKMKKEEEKMSKYLSKRQEESHADENEGTEVY